MDELLNGQEPVPAVLVASRAAAAIEPGRVSALLTGREEIA